MIPAFSAWIESPDPGISTSSTVSAIAITSTSLWPAPTVSRKTRSFPAASRTSSAWSVASASPPRWPRAPIERMKTPGSRKWSASRMRSPSSAPWENGLDGSTDTMPTSAPRTRTWRTSDEMRVDLPTPGGPVTPTAYARVADRACREEHDRAREPHPACAVGGHECAGDDRADAGEAEGGAHDERQRATAQLVDDPALHEQRVADDRDAVSDTGDDARSGGHPDVGARSADAEAEGHQCEPRAVCSRDSAALDERAAPEAPDDETGADAAVDQAVAEVARVECVLRHEHLADADRAARERGQAPPEQHGEERARAQRRGEAVFQVGPVAAAERRRALKEPRRN